jgi:hypothetical protein
MGAGAGNGATRRAEQAERERQASMALGEQRVNAAYDSPERQKQYDDFLKALRENFTLDANRQKEVADRRLKFAMARSGHTGGSVAVDSNRKLGEEFTKGIIGAENAAQGAVSDLRSDDEAARQSLIGMIRSGADATTASSRMMQLGASNAAGAKSRALTNGIGDIFSGTADVYMRSEDAAARRRGARDAQVSLYGKPFTG